MESESESNFQQENTAIDYFKKYLTLEDNLKLSQYEALWRAEYYYLSALALYLEKKRPPRDNSSEIYFEMDRLDLEKIQIAIEEK